MVVVVVVAMLVVSASCRVDPPGWEPADQHVGRLQVAVVDRGLVLVQHDHGLGHLRQNPQDALDT
jgi:hypothetical protein